MSTHIRILGIHYKHTHTHTLCIEICIHIHTLKTHTHTLTHTHAHINAHAHLPINTPKLTYKHTLITHTHINTQLLSNVPTDSKCNRRRFIVEFFSIFKPRKRLRREG